MSRSANIKPITPDSPDTTRGRPFLPLTKPSNGTGAPTPHNPSAPPGHPTSEPAHHSLAPLYSRGSPQSLGPGKLGKVSAVVTAASGCRSSKLKAPCPPGLPLIPTAPAANSPPVCEGNAGTRVALQASTKGAVSSFSKVTGKQRAGLKAGTTATGGRGMQLPGWNSDFSVQYDEPVSLKDQERAIRKQVQLPGNNTVKATAAAAAGRVRQPKTGIQQVQPSSSPTNGRVIRG